MKFHPRSRIMRSKRYWDFCDRYARGKYRSRIRNARIMLVRDDVVLFGSSVRFVGKPKPKETMVEFKARYVWT